MACTVRQSRSTLLVFIPVMVLFCYIFYKMGDNLYGFITYAKRLEVPKLDRNKISMLLNDTYTKPQNTKIDTPRTTSITNRHLNVTWTKRLMSENRTSPSLTPLQNRSRSTRTQRPAKTTPLILNLPQNISKNLKTRKKHNHRLLKNSRLNIVDLYSPSQDPADCILSKTKPPYTACIYKLNVDNTISVHLRNKGLWEEGYIGTVQNILNTDPDLGFIDIGANIGPWGLLAAAMGHKTVMVEPYPNHVSKIKKSAQVGKLTENIVLIQNAVSDSYEEFSPHFAWGDNNLGAIRMAPYSGSGIKMTSIYMDDLIPVVNFERALLKIDAEGFEDKALYKSDRLFKKVFIPYVLMEWAFPKYVFRDDKVRIMGLINHMMRKNYLPYSYQWKRLNVSQYVDWPLDIVWGHKLVTPVC